ncbi:hypothetical protein niasHS_013391 [Heterodera schachtii]|uniref:Uncharacterized protein n=1 Tax=Heterodera schachtii TaxID=97005 RepID=A0ABD2IPD6_HETSC
MSSADKSCVLSSAENWPCPPPPVGPGKGRQSENLLAGQTLRGPRGGHRPVPDQEPVLPPAVIGQLEGSSRIPPIRLVQPATDCQTCRGQYSYWLNIPQDHIDARLGWLQCQFHLREDELRLAIVKESRLIQFGVGPIQGLILALNQTPARVSVGEAPHVLVDLLQLVGLAYVMRITNEQIVPFRFRSPCAVRCRRHFVNRREFLFRLRKANYVPKTADQ